MAVCTIASARAATVGAGGSLRIASSVSSFQTRTRLSPVAARAGWDRPSMAARPRVMMRTRPMTMVSLRISRHPSPGPTRPGVTPKVASRVEDSNPGGGKDREQRGAGQDLPCISKYLWTGSTTSPSERPDRRPAVTPQPGQERQIIYPSIAGTVEEGLQNSVRPRHHVLWASGRLRLPPQAGRTAGPPRTRAPE
jgi:hypothetical protein